MAVHVPGVIDDFEVGGLLAGAVHRARQRSTGREVALKVLPAAAASNPTDRFLREARAATTVDHPNVVASIGCGEENGLRWLAMELVSGTDLERLSAVERRLPERRALKIIRDCCRALMAMHRAGLVAHGSIEPGNILVDSDGIAKLAELGLTRAWSKDVVTPFTPPERVSGPTEPDACGDVYALGATLFLLLTGRAPYEGEHGLALTNRILHFPVPDARSGASVSDATAALARKAMDKDPAERFQSATEMHEVIERALASIGVASTVRALSPRRWRAERAPRAAMPLIAGGALLVAGVMGGGAVLLARRGPGDTMATAGAPEASAGAAALVGPTLGLEPAPTADAVAPVLSSAPTAAVEAPPLLSAVALRALQIPTDGARIWSVDRGRLSIDPAAPLERVWLVDPSPKGRRLPFRALWTIDRVVVDRECSRRQAGPRPGFYCYLGVRANDADIDRAAQITGAALWLELRFETSRAQGMLVVANGDNASKRAGSVVRPSGEAGSDRLPPGHDRLDEFVLGGFSRSETLEVIMDLDLKGWRVEVRRDGGTPLIREAGWHAGDAPMKDELNGGLFLWAEVGNHLDGDGRGGLTCVVSDR